MTDFPITAYDRPSVALANLAQGDWRNAGKALWSPDELPPTRTSPLWKRMMGSLGEIAKDNPVLRGLLSVATDPLFIIGMVLSSRAPIALAGSLFKYGEKFSGYARRLGFFERLFGRAEKIFAGTPIPDLMIKATMEHGKFYNLWGGRLRETFEKFREETGRYPNAQENLALGAKLAKADMPGQVVPFEGHFEKMPPLLADKIVLSPALQKVHDGMAGFFEDFHRDVVAPLQKSNVGQHKLAGYAKELGARFGWSAERIRDQAGIVELTKETGYFPHTLVRTPSMIREYQEQMAEEFARNPAGRKGIYKAAAQSLFSGHAMPRFGVLTPSLEELRKVGPLNPDAEAILKVLHDQSAVDIAATELGGIQRVLGADTSSHEKINDVRKILRGRGFDTQVFERASTTTPSWGQMEGMLEEGRGSQVMMGIENIIKQGTGRREYSVNFTPVIQNYIHSFAKPFVWSTTPIGVGFRGMDPTEPLGVSMVRATARLHPDSANIMATDYLPVLMGQLTESQVSGMFRWNNLKLKALDFLDNSKMAGLIPATTKDKLKGMLLQERGGFSFLNAHSKMASYFYFSTLAGNPASAFQNLLQPIITTLPTVGPRAFWRGLSTTIGKLTGENGYFALRGKGVPSEEAFRKVFGEFVEMGMGPEPLTQSVLRDALESSWDGANGSVLGGMGPTSRPRLERLKRASMTLFSGSEKFNRLVTFEAGKAKAAMDGLAGADAMTFAGKLVRATQFPAGPGEMSPALLKLPAAWRQFLYFPLRYAGFLGESTAWQSINPATGLVNPRNWGTIGRSLAASSAAYHLLKEVGGVDVGRSLMFGALPLPSDYTKAPFFPMPLIPPLASILGNAAATLATGDTSYIKQSLPLLVPGGIQAKRLYKTLAPQFAGYDARTPDGRIPLYGANRALIGYATPMQLFMRAIGLRSDDQTAEESLARYLLKQRDLLREARRQYVEAVVDGNPEEAMRVNRDFRREFPGLGDLSVKPTDIRAAQDRRGLTRLQRLIRTFPAEYRSQFAETVGTAMAGYIGNMLPGDGEAPQSLVSPAETLGGVGIEFPAAGVGTTPAFGPASGGFAP